MARCSRVLVALALVSWGCSGKVTPGTDRSGTAIADSGSPSATPGVDGSPSAHPSAPPLGGAERKAMLCGANGRFDSVVRTEVEFKAKIVGRWMLCGTTSVFGTDEDGLEIAADGTWYELGESPEGMVRTTDPSDRGVYDVIDTSSMNGPGSYQLNLTSSQGGIMVHPQFTAAPVKMAVNNMGVYEAVYAASEQPSEELFGEPTVSARQSCPMIAPLPATPANQAEFEALITGMWLSCGGSLFGGSADVGIEIRSGGDFHRLYAGPSADTVVIGHGFGREGTWSVVDMSAVNGPGKYQLDLHVAGSGTTSVIPEVSPYPALTFPTGASVVHYRSAQ